MLVKDGYFILEAAGGESAWSDDGIWEGDEFIDTSKDEWKGRVLKDPYTLVKSTPLRDYLYASPYRCVSEKAYALIAANLNMWSEIQWTKIRVMDRRKRHLADYWWLKCNIFGGLKALDLQHSKYTVYAPHQVVQPGAVVVKNVEDWVLDSRVIGDLDWYHGDKVKWFVSPKAKNLIETHNLTGFMFTPVDVWTYDDSETAGVAGGQI